MKIKKSLLFIMSSDGIFTNLQVTGVSTIPVSSLSESSAPVPQEGSLVYNTDDASLYVSKGAGLGWQPAASGIISGLVIITNTTQSTSVSSGALVVDGGVGIAKNLFVGGTGNVAGVLSATSGTASTSTATGALVVTGGLGVSGAVNVGGAENVAGVLSATSGTASTSTATGALVVTGGLGVSGAEFLGGQLSAAGGATVPSTAGFVHSGTVTFSHAAGGVLGSITANSKVGSAAITNVNTIAAGATDTLTINNSAAGSAGLVALNCPTTAGGSAPYITSVTWTSGVSIVITIQNGGAAATGAAGAFTFSWISFN